MGSQPRCPKHPGLLVEYLSWCLQSALGCYIGAFGLPGRLWCGFFSLFIISLLVDTKKTPACSFMLCQMCNLQVNECVDIIQTKS